MLKLTILILFFGSFTLILYQFMPFILKIAGKWQEEKIRSTSQKLDNAFVDIAQKKVIYFHIFTPIALGIVGFILFRQTIWGLIGGACVGLFIPQIVVRAYEARRKKEFNAQLVDALMVLSGSLKAGLSLLQSFEVLVEEMPPPISQEFNLVIRENRMGISFEECLRHLKIRMKSEDLDLVVTAILVARDTGGDLTETFKQLVFTIRERNKLFGKVKTLTIQGRLQGFIMSLLPVGFAAFAYKINPHFFDIIMKDKLGQILMMYAAVSYIIGVILIRKFSKVEV